jgi:ACS family tartrate transporter-like MFS transporter
MLSATVEVANDSSVASALKKARWRLIPLLGLCYLVAYMDRVNISFAAESMNRDLHFSPKIYGLGAGLFFLSYAICEIPSNRMMVKFGARRWMARIMLTWGLLAAAMVLIRTPLSFYAMRLLLGVAEAGFFPGVIYYLSLWFPAAQRARAIAQFYIALPLSNVVMGGLAGLLLRQSGRLGLKGWQWLFLVEALPAVLLSLVVWFYLPNGPSSAKWLTESERGALDTRLRAEAAVMGDGAHGDRSVFWRVMRSPYVWLMGLFYFLTLGSNYSITFSLPTVLKVATGWSAGNVGWLVAGFGVAGAAAMVLNARSSDRLGERHVHIAIPVLVMAASLVFASALLRMGSMFSGRGVVAALLVATASYCALQGPILSLWSVLVAGDAVCAAVAIAAINMFGILGGFVGPYWMGYLREATGGYAVGLGSLSVAVLVGLACSWGMLRRFGRVPNAPIELCDVAIVAETA